MLVPLSLRVVRIRRSHHPALLFPGAPILAQTSSGMETHDEEVSPPPYSLHDPNPRPVLPTTLVPPRYTPNRSLLSGAAYFETRPLTLPQPDDLLSYYIRIPPTANPQAFPFPRPEHYLLERDVDYCDWTAFLNHLLPPTLGNPDGVCCLSAETFSRQRSICASVAEWNKEFFLPRGLRIVGDSPSCLCSVHSDWCEEIENSPDVWKRSRRTQVGNQQLEEKAAKRWSGA